MPAGPPLVEDAAKLAIDRELRGLDTLHLAATLMLPGTISSLLPGTAASTLLPALTDSRSFQRRSTPKARHCGRRGELTMGASRAARGPRG
jgi:hypothetical protein